ncbi:hypothetical protein ACHHYP_20769 [Achlya hypogyna]|uniref:Uncharacterized protein n=1 Tax=Achlya hypogyna TaxID=1202772 RepID=A0A1V9ZEX6_ACHHY|nr:hypothetical protein ACHHYP_20769 [Achlya hypogyna]
MATKRRQLRIVVEEPDAVPVAKDEADAWWRYRLPPPGHLGKHTIDEPRADAAPVDDQFTTPQSKQPWPSTLKPPSLVAAAAAASLVNSISPPTGKRSAESADLEPRQYAAKFVKAAHRPLP